MEQFLETSSLKPTGFDRPRESSTHAAIWFDQGKFARMKLTLHDGKVLNSSIAAPLINLKQLQVLLMLPTGESRLAWAKENIRRKWPK